MRLWVVAFCLAALTAGDDNDEAYDEPEVEPSTLERHEYATHSTQGEQFDFVRDAAEEQETDTGSSTAPQSLGALMQQLNQRNADGSGMSLVDMMGKLSEALAERQKLQQQQPPPQPRKQPPSSPPTAEAIAKARKVKQLTKVAVDTPVSEVLRNIRLSFEAAAPGPRAALDSSGSSSDADEEEEEDDEDEDEDRLAYIDHLDARGLRLLEGSLRRQLRRVQRRQDRLSSRASRRSPSSTAAVEAEAEEEADSGRRARKRSAAAPAGPGGAASSFAAARGTAASAGAEPGALRLGSEGLTAAQRERMGQLERALTAALGGSGVGLGAAALRDGAGEAESDGASETEQYEARLAREAETQRKRDAGEAEEEQGAVLQAVPLHEAVAKMFGGETDGNVFEMKIEVLGDGGEGLPVEVSFGSGANLAEMLAKAGISSGSLPNGENAEDDEEV